jgi:hypothetical protein
LIRLAIVVLHTALATGTTSAALLLLGQARANAVWEQSFYGATTDETIGVLAAGVVAGIFGLTHGTSAWAWFAGAEWGGWALVLASVALSAGASWGIVALLTSTSMLVMADLMVERARAAGLRDEPPTR